MKKPRTSATTTPAAKPRKRTASAKPPAAGREPGAAPFDFRAFFNTGDRSTEIKARARETVFAQGDPADAVFYIKSGRVQLTVVSDQGKEGVIALMGKGDFFGEGCLSGQPVRLASALTTTPSTLIRVDKATMARLLHERPDFSDLFTAFMVTRTIQVEADLVDQLFNSSEKRLARLLLLLANFNNDGGLRPISPKVSQEVMAARVGTTRSRINYFMNKFRRLGLIEYNGMIKVNNGLINVIVHE